MVAASRVVDQHVAGLDVAVHEPARVGGVERVGDRADECQRSLRGQGAGAPQQGAEVDPLHEAHRDEQPPVLGLARLVDRHDVGVVERRGQARLAQETVAKLRVVSEIAREQLQRHGAFEPAVEGPVDLPHPAAADQRLETVAGEAQACGGWPLSVH